VVCDLKTKFQEWEERLVGDDINSIRNQICDMIWDSAVFQSINECRRYAPTNAKGEIELNGVIHRFINRCFFETQASAIRRFLDIRCDVNSLYRLIDDIEEHCHRLTRGNILAVHSYPYEYEQEKKRISDETFKKGPGPHIMGQVYNKCEISEYTHKFIDSLAGVEPSKRSPHDCVRPQVFEWLKQRLSRCKEIVTFVNKFLAHSATPESRDYHNQQELDVTLGQILEAHKIICQAAIFISGRMGILSEGHGLGDVLAVPQYDQFVHFDKAWSSKETIEKLRVFWCAYEMQTRDWHNWVWEDDFKKFYANKPFVNNHSDG
jgi:hypothetical protein